MSDYLSFPFLCFVCRRSFKIDCSDCAWRHEWGVDQRGAETKSRPCPICGEILVFGGAYLRTPPQNNERRWKTLEALIRNGWRDDYPSPRSRPLLRSAPETRAWIDTQRQRANFHSRNHANRLKAERKILKRQRRTKNAN